MRGKTIGFYAIALGLVVAGGCGGSNRHGSGSGSGSGTTAAPVNSGSSGGGGSGTVPINTSTVGGVNAGKLTTTLVSSFTLNEVAEVDAATGTINNRWSVGNGPVDVVNDGTYGYAASAFGQNITVIDRLANNTVATIDVAGGPITGIPLIGSSIDALLKPLVRPTGIAVAQNGNKIYSANLLNVSIIDGSTYQVQKSIIGLSPVSLSGILSNPTQALSNFIASPIAGLGQAKVAATDTHALVTCMLTGNVMRIDGQTNDVIDYVPVGRAPIGITIAQNKAYVACALSQEIWVLDVTTGQVLTTIQGGMIPFDAATNKNQDRVYIANAMSGDVSVIDPAVDMIIDTLPAGTSITSLFAQAGLTIPTGSSSGGTGGGLTGMLSSFLQGFTAGTQNPSSFGGLLAQAFGSGGSTSGSTSGSGSGLGGLLSPGALINGLITAFLGSAGFTQQQLGTLALPGTLSVGVAHNPDLLISTNGFTGDLSVTDVPTRGMTSYPAMSGIGPADVAPIWPR